MRTLAIAAGLCASLVLATPPLFAGSQPMIRFGSPSGATLQTRPLAPLQVRPAPQLPMRPPAPLQVRPAPPQQRPPAIASRPMPPPQRFEPFPHHHHHDHHHRGPAFVFVEPPFGYSAYSPFFYPYAYPYSSSFYSLAPSPGYAPSNLSTPYYCWVDQIGFTDESRFAHHLHEVHGVPLDQAFVASERLGERYVFFGY